MESIDDYIEKQKSPQKEICIKLRKLIFNTFPKINEEMKWGVPAFDDGKFYLVALKSHVNLGFSSVGLSKDDLKLFDGGGKTTRHIKIKTINDIDTERIVKLLKIIKNKK